jgi:hypothetical protein
MQVRRCGSVQRDQPGSFESMVVVAPWPTASRGVVRVALRRGGHAITAGRPVPPAGWAPPRGGSDRRRGGTCCRVAVPTCQVLAHRPRSVPAAILAAATSWFGATASNAAAGRRTLDERDQP